MPQLGLQPAASGRRLPTAHLFQNGPQQERLLRIGAAAVERPGLPSPGGLAWRQRGCLRCPDMYRVKLAPQGEGHSLLLTTRGSMPNSLTWVMGAERTPLNARVRKTGVPGVYQPSLIGTQSEVICLVTFLVINSKSTALFVPPPGTPCLDSR